MRKQLATLALVLAACGSHRNNTGDDTMDGQQGGDGKPAGDACVGLQCRVVDCEAQGMAPTSLSGTVFAPNGTLPLYGVNVYVPNVDPPKNTPGAQCTRCDVALPGEPIVATTSDEHGNFKLTNVPTGTEVPLIISIGKWRKRVLVPNVPACQDTPLTAAVTSLPRTQLEGEMPQIAITTGACDAFECLVRRLGIADNEFTTAGGLGRVHLYHGNGGTQLANGDPIAEATTLWSDVNKLKAYDLILMSCECGQDADTKPQASMDAMKAYADLGGRVFGSHYHNVWIGGEYNVPTHAPAVWSSIGTWNDGGASPTSDTIDQVHNPKGASFANWMVNVQGSSTLGQVAIQEGRQTCLSIDNAKAERWVYYPSAGTEYPQNFQFTTPVEAPGDQRCGKVVFSDMHVASGSFSSGMFPSGCSTQPLTPQEKALAFMFFDIASCVPIVQ
jgi:hypothetical protein